MKPSLEPTPRTSEELEEEQLRQMMGEVTIGQESVNESQHSTRRKVRDLVDGDVVGDADYEAKLAWMQEATKNMPLLEGFFDTTDPDFFMPPSEFKFRTGFDTNPSTKPVDWDADMSEPKQ